VLIKSSLSFPQIKTFGLASWNTKNTLKAFSPTTSLMQQHICNYRPMRPKAKASIDDTYNKIEEFITNHGQFLAHEDRI
jgi:hypothetical protein